MKQILNILTLIAVFCSAGCGPVTVNTPSVASNRKIVFALDRRGKFTFLPESKQRGVYISDIYGNFLTRITDFSAIAGWCSFSPSNDMILFVEKGSTDEGEDRYYLKLYNLKTEEETLEFISTRFIWFPTWSPNGKYIAFAGEGKKEITVINWRLKGRESVAHRIKTNSVFFRWLPDATGFLTVDVIDELDSIDGNTLQYFVIRRKYLDLEKETEDLVRGYSRTCWPDISSDGNRIIFNAIEFTGPSSFIIDKIDKKENVYLYDYQSKKITPVTQGGISAFYTVISPDGTKAAFIDYNKEILSGGNIWIAFLRDGKPRLKKVWNRKNAVLPFWVESDMLGFIALDPYEKMGKGFDNIFFYNLGNSSLVSMKKRIQELFKTTVPGSGTK